MLVNSDSNLASNINGPRSCGSDIDSGTDDGVDAGLDETKSLLWRHISFIIAPNHISGDSNILFTRVMIGKASIGGEVDIQPARQNLINNGDLPIKVPIRLGGQRRIEDGLCNACAFLKSILNVVNH